MPGPAKTWGESLLSAINSGAVEHEIIDDKVSRILNVIAFSKRFDRPNIKPEKINDNPAQELYFEMLQKKVWFY